MAVHRKAKESAGWKKSPPGTQAHLPEGIQSFTFVYLKGGVMEKERSFIHWLAPRTRLQQVGPGQAGASGRESHPGLPRVAGPKHLNHHLSPSKHWQETRLEMRLLGLKAA